MCAYNFIQRLNDLSITACIIMMKRSGYIHLIIPLLMHLLMAVSATATPNITTDESALLALKTRITSDPYGIMDNWNVSSPVCNWTGVACGSRHLKVTALNVSDMGLDGEIPPELGNLSFLVSLDMTNNYFTGLIPQELSRLPRLRFLRLGYNRLMGSIPHSIFNISTLETLDFTNNSLSGILPDDMCLGLPILKGLHLSHNEIHGRIPSSFANYCPQLQIMSLSYNFFSGTIPPELGNLEMLKLLYLGNNNLSGVIPPSLSNLSSLEGLGLALNSIRGEIPGVIGNLHKLNLLNLGYNRLTGSIPRIIFNISTLQTIIFNDNNLSGILPDDMCLRLPRLEMLHVSHNEIHGRIPSSFAACPQLRNLSLSYNNFAGTIPPEIGSLGMLGNLYLGTNKLSGVIPQRLGELSELEYLNLDFNELSGSMPPDLFNISTLRMLSVSGNNLSGKLPSNFGDSLPNLEQLYLGMNNFDGVVPNSITNCSKLTVIELSRNRFMGAIPNSLGDLRLLKVVSLWGNNFTSQTTSSPELSFITSLTNCKYLTRLEVSNNPLNGILPKSVGNLSSSLNFFSINNGSISGYIPNEFGNLSGLGSLYLSQNNLGGVIPVTLGSLQNLQRLYLGQNQLRGLIPNSLCGLKNLGLLYLSENQLTGPIPECLGNVSSLRITHLDSNNLNSSIPDSIWYLQDLLALDISSNSLCGSLSPQIGNLESVAYVNLSMNHLSGDIPNTFQGLQSVINFSLAHNKFQGPIPNSIGGMLELLSLDLSHNNLSNVIPKSLEALKYLEYFNVSFNQLSGEIPSGGPFGKFTSESFISNSALCGLPRYQVSPCKESKGKSKMKKTIRLAFIIILTVAVVVLIGILAWIFVRRCRKNEPQTASDIHLTAGIARISYYEVLQSTNGLSNDNLLGRGSFGSVYKGVFRDGTILAIKVFNVQLDDGAFKTFDVECEVFRNLRHRNLTKVISSCSNPEFKALVLEYMPNGSLEKWLYSKDNVLSLMQRLSIMIDVASALEYLHHGYTTPVVHCDLKPSNVLLDENMTAQVSDFGISKLLGEGESTIHTRTLATIGYMAPEYGLDGRVSISCDVYSYGIMLLETFTSKQPSDAMFSGNLNLKNWVKNALPNGLSQVIDANLIRPEEEHFKKKMYCVSSVLELALRCSEDSPGERMNVKEVVAELKKIKNRLMA